MDRLPWKPSEELAALVAELCCGSPDDEDMRRLETILSEDRQARRYLHEYMDMHVEIRWVTTAQRRPHLRAETVPSLSSFSTSPEPGANGHTPSPQTVHRTVSPTPGFFIRGIDYLSHPTRFGFFFATVMMASLLLVAAQVRMPQFGATKNAKLGHDSAPFVARFTDGTDIRWGNEWDAPFPAAYLRAGQSLEIREGVAEFSFSSGAIVLVEGPAVFVPEGDNRGRLKSGRLVAKVVKSAAGFTVETPVTTVVDLGTEFVIEVDGSGSTDVYVVKGLVKLPQDRSAELPVGQWVTLSAGQAMRVPADRPQALARLPYDHHRVGETLKAFTIDRPVMEKREPETIVHLGRLFDNPKKSTLEGAMRTDVPRAVVDGDELGVERVLYSGKPVAEICPKVRFDMTGLGWQEELTVDLRVHVRNGPFVQVDKFSIVGGKAAPTAMRAPAGGNNGNNDKHEEGIGTQANSMITFDLDELRGSGGLAGKSIEFVSDRAGINGMVTNFPGKEVQLGEKEFEQPSASIHLTVLLSDATGVRVAVVNGRRAEIGQRDDIWSLASEIGKPLAGDGRFVDFRVPVPAQAKYLTLIATSTRGDGVLLESDHAFWGGARLEVFR